MLDNKRHMFLCNTCKTGRCSKDTFKQYERFGSSSQCKLYNTSPPLRVPIMIQLLSDPRKVNAAYKTLDDYDLVFHEIGNKPGFEFTKRRLRG